MFSLEQQSVIWTADIWVEWACPLGIVCRRENDSQLFAQVTYEQEVNADWDSSKDPLLKQRLSYIVFISDPCL